MPKSIAILALFISLGMQAQDTNKVKLGFHFGASWSILDLSITEGYDEVFGSATVEALPTLGGLLGMSVNVPLSQRLYFQGSASAHISKHILKYGLATGEETNWVLPMAVNIDLNMGYKLSPSKNGFMVVGGGSLNQYVSEVGASRPVLNKTIGSINIGMAYLRDREKIDLRFDLLYHYSFTDFSSGQGEDVYTLAIESLRRHTISFIFHFY